MKIFYRNRLPHYVPMGATLFVTFRLAGSLPQGLVYKLKAEMREAISRIKMERRPGFEQEIAKQKQLFFGQYDYQLDHKPFGPCYLKNASIARVVCHKLHALDGQLYWLLAYCAMPNHVHILIDTSLQLKVREDSPSSGGYVPLQIIMKRIKGATAYQANKILGRTGKSFWQKESYDRCIRNQTELHRVLHYIIANPVKAKLVQEWQDYPYTYLYQPCSGEL